VEKEKEEQKNELLNEQKPTAANKPAEESVSTVSGDQTIEKTLTGESKKETISEPEVEESKESTKVEKPEIPAETAETPVIVSQKEVIVKAPNSHVYKIKERVEGDEIPEIVKQVEKRPEPVERTEKSAESTKPVHKIEEFAKQGEKIPELVKSTETTPEQVIVEKPASTSGLTSVLEPKVPSDNAAGKDEVPQKLTPVSNELKSVVEEFPFQDDLKAIEKKIEPENESSEEKTEESPKAAAPHRNETRAERGRPGQNRDNTRTPGNRNQTRVQQPKKESTPDPTIVNVKVDKGLVKTPGEIETPVTVTPPPARVRGEVPLRREPRENTRQPHTRTENTRTTVNREKEPVAPVEEKEPVVRQERVTKEPVTRNEPREREITPRPDNRDRDRNSGRRNPREPYRSNQQQSQAQQPPQKPKLRFNFNKVSVVIPLFNEDESLIHLANEIKSAFKDLPLTLEVIFVDDGSTDKSLRIIKDLCRTDQRFKYISFQQNFGKSAALNVGFKAAKGDVVVTMDADLQDDPHEIVNLLKKIEEGHDMVSGWKKTRYDPFIKKYTSRLFNFVTAKMSGIKIHDFNCGLKAYKKTVVDNLNIYGEMHRYIPILAKWKGFTVTELPVKHSPRKFGVTKFGASRFFKGFVDLITVTFITRYIKRPMHLFGFFGAIAFLLGFAINGYLSYEWIFDHQPLSNRPLLLLGMLLMIVGVQFFTTGLLGELMVHNFQTDKEYSIKDSNIRG
jgi:glycosyltransferase involved in cell wall biosynthesis